MTCRTAATPTRTSTWPATGWSRSWRTGSATPTPTWRGNPRPPSPRSPTTTAAERSTVPRPRPLDPAQEAGALAVTRVPEPVSPLTLARAWRARSFQRMRRVVEALWGPLTLTWAVTRPVLVFQVAVPSTTVSATNRTLWRSSLTLASPSTVNQPPRSPRPRDPGRYHHWAMASPTAAAPTAASFSPAVPALLPLPGVAGVAPDSRRGNSPTTRTSGMRLAQDTSIECSRSGWRTNWRTSPLAQPQGSARAVTWMVFSTLTQRVDGPSCSATTAPSVQGVSVSSPPERTSTGRVRGTSGGWPSIGGSSRTRAGQLTQSSDSATGEVVHSSTVKGANTSSGRASAAASYWAQRTAGGAR